MGNRIKEIDDYIAKSAPFAQPIMHHLRDLMHLACPDIQEKIKWGSPNFDYKGQVVMIAAFKEHLGMGFMKHQIMKDPYHLLQNKDEALGSLGKIRSMADLPSDDIMIEYIRDAVALNEAGVKRKVVRYDLSKLETPEYVLEYLSQSPAAKEQFDKFTPGNKKEYIEWFEEAKTEATRTKRIETALKWIAEGKSRNWKYQKK